MAGSRRQYTADLREIRVGTAATSPVRNAWGQPLGLSRFARYPRRLASLRRDSLRGCPYTFRHEGHVILSNFTSSRYNLNGRDLIEQGISRVSY